MGVRNNLALDAATVIGLTGAIAVVVDKALTNRLVRRTLRRAWDGWRQRPGEMAIKLGLSALLGQGVFWLLGYDQLGFFMSPMKEFGLGHGIANHVADWLPTGQAVVWIVKGVEISTDAARIFIEGKLYLKRGYVPDVVATLATSPLWQCYEVAEKLSGVLLHPERLNTRDQLVVSLACIYGNLFRYGLDAVLWFWGDDIYMGVRKGAPRLVRRRA
jgi:hypothetical protein